MIQPSKEAARSAVSFEVPDALYQSVARYYTGKLERFGASALGVDWNCELTQQLRFVQLLKLCGATRPFSINDLGCGYGALVPFLDRRRPHKVQAYRGVDLSEAMIAAGRRLYAGRTDVTFEAGNSLKAVADYSVASGIFNVKLEQPRQLWEAHVRRTLAHLAQSSELGFAVNFLLPLENAQAAAELYCTEPDPWIAYCREELRWDAELVRDYGLREFTLIARPPRRGS